MAGCGSPVARLHQEPATTSAPMPVQVAVHRSVAAKAAFPVDRGGARTEDKDTRWNRAASSLCREVEAPVGVTRNCDSSIEDTSRDAAEMRPTTGQSTPTA